MRRDSGPSGTRGISPCPSPPASGTLTLIADEVAWGRFEALEQFCIDEGLSFSRWSGACPCQWGPERVVLTGSGEPTSYPCYDEDIVVIGRDHVDRLGSFDAVIAYFDAADVPLPPLVLGPALPS